MSVSVWVSGDGGDWSCGPSSHFRIPTSVFDLNMAVGRLNTKQDLEEVAEQAFHDGNFSQCDTFTDVYVAPDGNWAGLPPRQFHLPVDVFDFLVKDGKSTYASIGSLTCEQDVESLVSATRQEMTDEDESILGVSTKGSCGLCGKVRAVLNSEGLSLCKPCHRIRAGATNIIKARTEIKICGHSCTTSSLKEGCCACLDLRPMREGNCYPRYQDGVGWSDDAQRNEGYCHYCRLEGAQSQSLSPSFSVAALSAELGLSPNSAAFVDYIDSSDSVLPLCTDFLYPTAPPNSGRNRALYLCGNSLGLQPATCRTHVLTQLDKWAAEGVEGHFTEPTPWLTIDDTVKASMATLVGANPSEVVLMNSLTSNLHFMMAAFFRPNAQRFKILIEKKAFPSDVHAVTSQLLHHGLDPNVALLEVAPRSGEVLLRHEDIETCLHRQGREIALVLLSGVQYYTGQFFDVARITAAAHEQGCFVGWDLAHAVGNVPLELHAWGADFACWCTYKYLNCGPGSIGGCFVHERHGAGGRMQLCGSDAGNEPQMQGRVEGEGDRYDQEKNSCIPLRLAGWWGHRLDDRFVMDPQFVACAGADGFRVSNPPVLLVACARASLVVFEKAGGMSQLRAKSLLLTGLLEHLILSEIPNGEVTIFTPSDPARRGCQLSLTFRQDLDVVFKALQAAGVVCDVRKPNVMRVAPCPLYNSARDVFDFVNLLKNALACN